MFFFLRCAFWLGLVYLAMARDAGAFRFLAAPQADERALAAVRMLDKICARSPKLCERAAAATRPLALAAEYGGGAPALRASALSATWRGRPGG